MDCTGSDGDGAGPDRKEGPGGLMDPAGEPVFRFMAVFPHARLQVRCERASASASASANVYRRTPTRAQERECECECKCVQVHAHASAGARM